MVSHWTHRPKNNSDLYADSQTDEEPASCECCIKAAHKKTGIRRFFSFLMVINVLSEFRHHVALAHSFQTSTLLLKLAKRLFARFF